MSIGHSLHLPHRSRLSSFQMLHRIDVSSMVFEAPLGVDGSATSVAIQTVVWNARAITWSQTIFVDRATLTLCRIMKSWNSNRWRLAQFVFQYTICRDDGA